jgi:gag-polypeptide of LTR copia-type
LQPTELTRVVELQTAHEMWTILADEYGQTSELSRARAESAFHFLIKSDTATMKEHIDIFQKLRTDVDYHVSSDVSRLFKGQINLAFMRFLGPAYEVYHDTLGDDITIISINELYVKAKD